MRTKMKIVKNWILAFVIAVLIGNSVSLIYERPTGWIDRENSSTPAIFNPGSVLVHNTEWHGVYQADKNGYFNKGTLVDSGYTIITGASHTAGKEVAYGYRYSDLLNLMLKSDSKYSEDDIVAYNVSMDAYFFPAIINGFSCIVSEFPNSDNIVIEVGKTNFDVESLETALPQKLYSESERGALITQTLSFKKKLSMTVKEMVPLTSRIKTTLKTISKGNDKDSVNDSLQDLSLEDYRDALNLDLSTIREEYGGNLIILYHPTVTITDDGMTVDKEVTTPIFAEVCAENNITFVDMTESFQRAYEEDYTVPYGFNNTSMGAGHLNADGHRLIAEALYPYLVNGGED